jgi:hypothetical protein
MTLILTQKNRKSYVDLAKSELAKMFEERPETVFYQLRLQVMFEKRYFRWVTVSEMSRTARNT